MPSDACFKNSTDGTSSGIESAWPFALTDPKRELGRRLSSLDQFRGYTVLGMLVVNYSGDYAACPQLWKHSNDYLSYADTIMPQFLFAVGFSLRLTV
ncbi:MAG: hypothetical protein ACKN85_13260, partial [Pirellula sp.]